jgi:hypothetical protein
MKLNVGDYVVVMHADLVPIEEDVSTYYGIPCIVHEIKGERIFLHSPLKVCWGKPPIDEAPISQLIKINSVDAEEYIKGVRSHDTYKRTRGIQ